MVKIFVTGATGFIGNVTLPELIQHGHEIIGLARSEASAKKLKKLGVEVLRGDLEDLDSIKRGAELADGVLHLGFIHIFDQYEHAVEVDRKVIQTVGDLYKGSNKFLVFTSTTTFTPIGVERDEDTPLEYHGDIPLSKRAENESVAFGYTEEAVRVVALRLPPTVHGDEDRAFIPSLISLANHKGYSAYADEGANVWAAVHKLDAAVAFRLALEKAPSGSILHSIAEPGVSTKQISEVIAKKLKIKSISYPAENLPQKLDPFYGQIFALNNHAFSTKTQKLLNWKPSQRGLLEDIKSNY